MYAVWSVEHQSWWGPSRHGYTPDIFKAGLYSLSEACEICRESNLAVDFREYGPEEAIVPISEELVDRIFASRRERVIDTDVSADLAAKLVELTELMEQVHSQINTVDKSGWEIGGLDDKE